jgi:acetyltransferase-like isoleucine patch superfamily enzyme
MIIKLFNFIKKYKYKVKSKLYSFFLGSGAGLKVYGNIYIENPINLKVGKNVTLNHGVYLNARGLIYIGDNVRVSAGCKILTTGLNADNEHYQEAVNIKDNCWLGANSIILPGVTIEEGTIVGAGAVVTKSYLNKGGKLLGVPARSI